MRKRTSSREFALQVLYQVDLAATPAREALENFWAAQRLDVGQDVKDYTEMLVLGVLGHLEAIDRLIEKFAENWVIQRMAYVDRNILRLSTFEMRHREDIPVKVAINEAVELAKRYGEPDSSKFVNGILDRIAKTETKP
jgi:N utilization substance protein B